MYGNWGHEIIRHITTCNKYAPVMEKGVLM